jgi:hypothetical protein
MKLQAKTSKRFRKYGDAGLTGPVRFGSIDASRAIASSAIGAPREIMIAATTSMIAACTALVHA